MPARQGPNAVSTGDSASTSTATNNSSTGTSMKRGTSSNPIGDALLAVVERAGAYLEPATTDDTTASELMARVLVLKQQMVSSHAPNFVGWWCSLLDYLSYLVLFCCIHPTRWAGELILLDH
jgi:hypothetical protein